MWAGGVRESVGFKWWWDDFDAGLVWMYVAIGLIWMPPASAACGVKGSGLGMEGSRQSASSGVRENRVRGK